jgi:transglutaminase/protease-like cytokinesis protein 3
VTARNTHQQSFVDHLVSPDRGTYPHNRFVSTPESHLAVDEEDFVENSLEQSSFRESSTSPSTSSSNQSNLPKQTLKSKSKTKRTERTSNSEPPDAPVTERQIQKTYSLISQISVTENELWGVLRLPKREKAFVKADPDQQGRDTIRKSIRLSTRAQARLRIYKGIRGIKRGTAPKKPRNIHKNFSEEQIREANKIYDEAMKKKAEKQWKEYAVGSIKYPYLQNCLKPVASPV